MLYICTHMATVDIKGLTRARILTLGQSFHRSTTFILAPALWSYIPVYWYTPYVAHAKLRYNDPNFITCSVYYLFGFETLSKVVTHLTETYR